MSASVPLGEIALFMCAGEAITAYWTVNGEPDSVQASRDRGIAVYGDNTDPVSYKTNLTIPGTVENDNVSIQCVLIDGSNLNHSPIVYLTVLGESYIT